MACENGTSRDRADMGVVARFQGIGRHHVPPAHTGRRDAAILGVAVAARGPLA
jgi:hypothetical protein